MTVYLGDLYERVTRPLMGEVEHRYHVHAAERVVAVVTRPLGSAATTRYVHVDNLGSVDVLSDEAGGEHERRSYDAFGERRNPVWGVPPPASFGAETRPGFTGHERDDEVGLINMKGRVYDPKTGRFLTPDPIVSRPHFSQSWNPYAYVLNNPLAYVDPTGLTDEPPGGGAPAGDQSQINLESPVVVVVGLPPEGEEDEDPGDDREVAAGVGASVPPADVGTFGK